MALFRVSLLTFKWIRSACISATDAAANKRKVGLFRYAWSWSKGHPLCHRYRSRRILAKMSVRACKTPIYRRPADEMYSTFEGVQRWVERATSDLYLCIIWIYYRTSKLTPSENTTRILPQHTSFRKTKSINAQFSFRGEENKTALKPTTALKQRGVKAIFCIRHKGTAVYLAIFYHFFIVFVVHVFNKIQSQEGAKFLRTSPLPSYISQENFPTNKDARSGR